MALDGPPADLAGTLADCRPLAVLCFLASTHKSGVLRVKGPLGQATIWLHDGSAVAAEGEGPGDVLDSVVDALRTPRGEFTFEQREVPAPAFVPPAMDTLLRRAIEELEAWQELSDSVPSMSLVVTLQQTTEAEVNLSSSAWTLSVAVAAGHATPAAAAAHLGWSALRTCRAVKELVDAGRARLEAPPKRSRSARDRSTVAGAVPWDPGRQPLWPGAGLDEGARFKVGWDSEA